MVNGAGVKRRCALREVLTVYVSLPAAASQHPAMPRLCFMDGQFFPRDIYIYIYVYIDVFVLTNFGGLIFLGHDESGF